MGRAEKIAVIGGEAQGRSAGPRPRSWKPVACVPILLLGQLSEAPGEGHWGTRSQAHSRQGEKGVHFRVTVPPASPGPLVARVTHACPPAGPRAWAWQLSRQAQEA